MQNAKLKMLPTHGFYDFLLVNYFSQPALQQSSIQLGRSPSTRSLMMRTFSSAVCL
jgi:hypothetical protein